MADPLKSQAENGWLFVIPWGLQHVGGVNEVVRNLHDQMHGSAALTPHLLVQSWPDTTLRSVTEDGRDVNYLRLRSPGLSARALVSLFAYLLFLPAELTRLRRFLANNRIAAINVHYPTLSLLTFVLLKTLRLYRGRLYVSLHGTDISQIAAASRAERSLWSWMMARVDAVIACSSGLRDSAAAALPAIAGDLRVIHNGVDVERTRKAAARGSSGEASGSPFLLAIGSYQPVKGFDVLLRAYARAREQDKTVARLLIAGRDGPEFSNCKRLIAELGLQGSVRLLLDLSHDDCMALLQECRYYVLSSRREAFSIALLEAGALGKAVIATDVCGVRELLGDAPQAGLIVETEDEDALAAAMLTYSRDPDQAARNAALLESRVAGHFSWQQAALHYRELLLSGCG